MKKLVIAILLGAISGPYAIASDETAIKDAEYKRQQAVIAAALAQQKADEAARLAYAIKKADSDKGDKALDSLVKSVPSGGSSAAPAKGQSK